MPLSVSAFLYRGVKTLEAGSNGKDRPRLPTGGNTIPWRSNVRSAGRKNITWHIEPALVKQRFNHINYQITTRTNQVSLRPSLPENRPKHQRQEGGVEAECHATRQVAVLPFDAPKRSYSSISHGKNILNSSAIETAWLCEGISKTQREPRGFRYQGFLWKRI